MAMQELRDQMVDILRVYLGPAADRFLDRQIESHLDKPPEEITYKDIAILREWLKVSLGLFTEDKQQIDECLRRFDALKVRSAPAGGGSSRTRQGQNARDLIR